MAHSNARDFFVTPNPSAVLEVNNPNTRYTEEAILSEYEYRRNVCQVEDGVVRVQTKSYKYLFKTQRKVGKTGVMLVGWGGNNGSTVTAGIIANRENICWMTKEGKMQPNYHGSITQAATFRVGSTPDGKEVYLPLRSVLPLVHPNDLVMGGWDINKANLAEAMERAEVLDYDLQRQLKPKMKHMVPLPSIYYPDFIAANQSERANNLIPPGTKQQHLTHIRKDMRDFKAKHKLDHLIIMWTANTERFTEVRAGLNLTSKEVLASIKRNEAEVSPSQLFAVAAILEGCPFINGSPQNTLVPGIVELAQQRGVFVGGDDFKSGQTKMKSVLVDFLVSAGIKVEAIASYNHLGNNDGRNLSAPQQFRSKEISKSNVVDDMVASNPMLYGPEEYPDHCVVIKYVPYVKDSKRALDEYTSSIFMHGRSTIVLHNTCEDSLLAAPLILDLVILTQLMCRVTFRTSPTGEEQSFFPVLSILSYLLKAPMVTPGTPVINSLFRQQRAISNTLAALVGLEPDNDLMLEYRSALPAPCSVGQVSSPSSLELPLLPGNEQTTPELSHNKKRKGRRASNTSSHGEEAAAGHAGHAVHRSNGKAAFTARKSHRTSLGQHSAGERERESRNGKSNGMNGHSNGSSSNGVNGNGVSHAHSVLAA
eukprot:g55927.t1